MSPVSNEMLAPVGDEEPPQAQPGHEVAGLGADGVVPDRPPVLVVPEVPVVDDLDVERAADVAEEGDECVRRGPCAVVDEEAVAAPLQREGAHHGRVARGIGRLERPERARVARLRLQRLRASRPDERVGDVFDAAARAVAVVEGEQLPFQLAGRGSEGAHRRADDVERERLWADVVDVRQHTDAVDLGRPVPDVVDLDQRRVERDLHPLAREPRVHLREREPVDRGGRRGAELDRVAVDHRGQPPSLLAGHVTVRQRVGLDAVADEAADRPDPLGALRVCETDIAAAEETARKAEVLLGEVGGCGRRRKDDAGRHLLAVREVEETRHHVVRVRLDLLRGHPVVDEDEDAGPRVLDHA